MASYHILVRCSLCSVLLLLDTTLSGVELNVVRNFCWCSRRVLPNDPVSEVILEVRTPELVNQMVTEGVWWDGRSHQCMLYDNRQKVKQCFSCQTYGHIGTQCMRTPACGKCAKNHQSKGCMAPDSETIGMPVEARL